MVSMIDYIRGINGEINKEICRLTVLSYILSIFSYLFAEVQPMFPIPHLHAHNDYNNERQLIDALSYGFRSIEVDIFLMTNDLYVAHTIADIWPGRTLKELYLDPLKIHI